jgi:hypothetical protein
MVFAESPFKPLREHAKKVVEVVHKLEDIMEAYCDGDMSRVEELSEEISDLEHEADKIKQRVRERLPSSILLPVNRQDLLEFLKPQDSIADSVEDVAKLLTFKDSHNLPEDIKKCLTGIAEMTIKIVDAYEKVIDKTSQVLSASFRRREIDETMSLIATVEEMEHEVDIIEIGLGKKIFNLEEEIGATGVYHLSEAVKRLCDVSDYAARAADRLRTMLYK